jgi:hypothetical protein
MTMDGGYALGPGDALEDLDMGGGSVLSLKVTGQQSNGLLTVLEGVVLSGGSTAACSRGGGRGRNLPRGRAGLLGEERGALEPGGLSWFPRGVPHTVANLSDGPVRFLTVVTPSGIEGFFRAQRDYLAEVSNGRPFDPAAFGSVPGQETRIVVGPPLS